MRASYLYLLLLGACGAGGADRAGAPGGDDDGTGGNVGFGGAQDIGELRAILDRGEIPGPDTLDANGFFNEHFNPIPTPTCGNTLCLNPGLSVGRDWLTGAHQATLQIAIATNVDPTTFTRLPMNLVVVVDHSGSMASDGRLDKVKAGLDTLIDNLKDEDRLAIISFDDVVTTDAPFAATLDRPHLHQVVAGLQPRGGTNIFDGLSAGFDMLGDAPPSEKQNRIIFLSDGLATVGDTSQDHIIAMASERIMRGIGLTTIGVGNDFDVNLMRGLAERGAGNFYFLDNPAAATEVFTEELDYFMTPLGLDLQIEATASDGWTMGTVTGSKLWQASPGRGSMQVPAAFLASRVSQQGEQGRRGGGSMIFIDMHTASHAGGNIARITLSYRKPGSTERVSDTVALDYNADPQDTPDDPFLTFAEMTERYAMYNMYLGLRAATDAVGRSGLDCAASALLATRQSAVAWNTKHAGDPDIEADLTLLDQFLANLRAKGSTTESTDVSTCALPGDGGWDEGGEGQQPVYGCYSASKASGGWLLIVGSALATILARRRRR